MINYLKSFRLDQVYNWSNAKELKAITYNCSFCGTTVSSATGYYTSTSSTTVSTIRICPSCHFPTLIAPDGKHFPECPPGASVPNLPIEIEALYNEARQSAGANAPTAAVLICRKLLMNIAVTEGAEEGWSFLKYVEYLASKGYIPPKGKDWVDYVRKRGNEANHEIELMEHEDAVALVSFVEMLLRFIYEFPNMVPITKQAEPAPTVYHSVDAGAR